ncbi:outer membrane protein transport protein [Dyella sp. RRB7]|uniref:OmpP1/FadL family transporter n=1 Tax=Dyella sp. RRB7 TaxID=2919502 RepID=UPI001FA9966B|nr:outer membrane protein transport protein [Dyella sp. RRB7]
MKLNYLAKISGCSMMALWAGAVGATDAFNLIGHGPVSEAMGGIGVAYDIGPGAMVTNPATLLLMPEGSRFDVGMDIVTADYDIQNRLTGEVADSHTMGRNNGPYYAPEIAYVWRQGRYAVGIGAFASDGVGTQFSADSFLSHTLVNNLDTGLRDYSRLLVLRIPLSVAYQVTDKLSVGASLDAVWTGVNLGLLLDTTQLGSFAEQGRLKGSLVPTLLSIPELSGGYLDFNNNQIAGGKAESWGLGGRVGLTYQVEPETLLGLSYNFKTHVGDLTGGANLTAVSALVGNIPLAGEVALRHFEMPAQITAGASHRFTDQFSVAFDYQRVFWRSVLKDIDVAFVQGGTGGTLGLAFPLNYRDTNVFALGTEYRYDAHWTFRGGFHYAQEAAPGSGTLALIPSTPTTNVTGGVAYAFGHGSSVDFAIAYGFRKTDYNSSLPDTAVPVVERHGQTVAAITYTGHF